MYEKSFFKRLCNYGLKKIVLSYDFLIFIIVIFTTYLITNGFITKKIADEMLTPFMEISASLFAIVLAGLAIVTSFTDREFIYAWKKIGEFDNMITLFQYNLYVPLVVLVYSIILRFVIYHPFAMIILIGLFSYMISSLIDLVSFVCRYGLQRGEFVKQIKD